MENLEHEHASQLALNIENIIGAKTVVRKRKKTQDDYKKELFFKIIHNLEHLDSRNELAEIDLKINLSDYNAPYEETIEYLLTFTFGKDITKLVWFYLYERFAEDGSMRVLTYEKNPVPLENVHDLWTLVQNVEKRNNPKKYN